MMPYSYCLDWGAVHKATNGTEMSVEVEREYSMQVLVEAPLAMADRNAGMTSRIVPVSGVCCVLWCWAHCVIADLPAGVPYSYCLVRGGC